MIDVSKIKVGDRITFRSPTRYNNDKATRIVRSFGPYVGAKIGVKYNGYDPFWVKDIEVLEHHPQEEDAT